MPLEAREHLRQVVLDQHLAVDVVELAEGARERQRDDGLAARLGDPRELLQRALRIVDVEQTEVRQDEVVDLVGEAEEAEGLSVRK